jgi:hypothetical protein
MISPKQEEIAFEENETELLRVQPEEEFLE